MKRLAVICLVSLFVALSFGSAYARPSTHGFGAALRAMDGPITVPPEWDGIWTTADSTYDCTAGFTEYSTGKDTICGGRAYSQAPPGPVTFTCNGTSDATSIHVTCSGSSEIFPDCQATYVIQTDVTRTGETYRSVTTIDVTYSGTGEGCSLLPSSCTRDVTYGTRTGPAPLDFCLTSVKRSSWGQLKILYR